MRVAYRAVGVLLFYRGGENQNAASVRVRVFWTLSQSVESCRDWSVLMVWLNQQRRREKNEKKKNGRRSVTH